MTPRQLAELATAVARHAEELSAAGGPDPAALHRVWKRSARCFRGWRERLVGSATPALYAELFAAELPLRVWCTAVAAAAQSRPASPGPAIGAKVFGDLLDVRCMALQALAAEHGLTTPEASALDRFRRRCERWADVLLGPLTAASGVIDYTFRPDRAADFAGDSSDPFGDSFWPLATAGLRLAFVSAESFCDPSATHDDDAAIGLAAAIVSSFPACAFGAEGVLRPLLLARAGRVINEGRPRPRRKPPRPTVAADEPAPAEAASVEPPRAQYPISFSSFRKRRPSD